MIFLLVAAGYETTGNLIGNGAWALLCHPDQLRLLRGDPSLIMGAIEEILGSPSPNGSTSPVLPRHLGFGMRIHFCLGAPLARIEAAVALKLLVGRSPELRLAEDPTALRWRDGVFVHGL